MLQGRRGELKDPMLGLGTEGRGVREELDDLQEPTVAHE